VLLERGRIHFTGDAPRAAFVAFRADPDDAWRAGYLVALQQGFAGRAVSGHVQP